jgi:hypothetical protein
MARCSLKELQNEVEAKGEYQVKASQKIIALEDLDVDVNNIRAWETVTENIKMLTEESLGLL